MNKIFAIYKPKGPTSNDIVQSIKRIAGGEKVGHAGTLDPLAEGVLVVGVGEATKKLGIEVKKEKEYIAKIKLGETSTTDDEEGEKSPVSGKKADISEIKEAIKKFTGKIKQIPPIYSAIKVAGKEAYKFARKGEKPVLLEREAEIKEIEILEYEWPYLELRAVTGPGVYIRALARDIGKKLGTGGYLAALKRTRVGDYTEEKSLNLDQLEKIIKHGATINCSAGVKKDENMNVNFEEFKKLELKVGKVLEAERVEGSEKLLKLSVDLGEENPRQILAGVGKVYSPEEMVGREIIVVANLEPRILMGLESQGMLLAANDVGIPVLLKPDRETLPGSLIS